MKPRILLVNPPIYDFAAYDFWLKPYGLLQIAGFLRHRAEFVLFDYLDRCHSDMQTDPRCKDEAWSRGHFRDEQIAKPSCLAQIPRRFRRYGLARERFQDFLVSQGPFDFVLLQSMMTYWYPGVVEAIEDLRQLRPEARIVLGGNYATLCPYHAAGLGPDLVVPGLDLDPLWSFLQLSPDLTQPALWEVYPELKVGVLKITQGCPFRCSYCAVQQVYGPFQHRSLDRALAAYRLLADRGVTEIAFYDDALLYQPEAVLIPFLDEVTAMGAPIHLHSPNALNARFLSADLAQCLARAGFKTFYLGFESVSEDWQRATGGKVQSHELTQAVHHLVEAGVDPWNITAYQILGHPQQNLQELEASLHFVHNQGIRGMLADFSPIPGTPDGDSCAQWVDMTEPLLHNKTAFPFIHLGADTVNRFKALQKKLNQDLTR